MKKIKLPLVILLCGLSVSLAVAGTDEAQTAPTLPTLKPTVSLNTPKEMQKNPDRPKISQDLLNLYKTYQAQNDRSNGRKTNGSLEQPMLPVSDGFVTIDAIASNDTKALKTDMETLGLKNSASFGRVVSGLFPISQISKLSDLKSLKYVRASSAITHN
ncbi:MAG: hypothetical protein NPINA01_28380 [Nitrospinaceae bacterium]|nr:MAG: hypothetical protein NPINA01_28380 [Nitrospinaceae bacterium]